CATDGAAAAAAAAAATAGREQVGWKARGSSHLCEADMYETEYEFRFRGVAVEGFDIRYVVKGPRKDYISTTTFKR
ncbi:hypothetical protein LTS18_002169, partial [Coniosporium uncinatum]